MNGYEFPTKYELVYPIKKIPHFRGNKYEDSVRDSASEVERKSLPRGNADWAGWDHVYDELNKACKSLAGDCDQPFYQGVLGCGHEETMKYYMAIAQSRGLCGSRN